MKISVDSVTKSPRKYPYLGISGNGRLVLFTGKETGLCLRSVPSCSKELTYSSSWMEHQFSLYEGTVTLTNN